MNNTNKQISQNAILAKKLQIEEIIKGLQLKSPPVYKKSLSPPSYSAIIPPFILNKSKNIPPPPYKSKSKSKKNNKI